MTGRLRILLVLLVAVGSWAGVRMIHRRKLNLSYSLLWIVLALVLMVFVLFPDTVAWLAAAVGIDLPLNGLLLFCPGYDVLLDLHRFAAERAEPYPDPSPGSDG